MYTDIWSHALCTCLSLPVKLEACTRMCTSIHWLVFATSLIQLPHTSHCCHNWISVIDILLGVARQPKSHESWPVALLSTTQVVLEWGHYRHRFGTSNLDSLGCGKSPNQDCGGQNPVIHKRCDYPNPSMSNQPWISMKVSQYQLSSLIRYYMPQMIESESISNPKSIPKKDRYRNKPNIFGCPQNQTFVLESGCYQYRFGTSNFIR